MPDGVTVAPTSAVQRRKEPPHTVATAAEALRALTMICTPIWKSGGVVSATARVIAATAATRA